MSSRTINRFLDKVHLSCVERKRVLVSVSHDVVSLSVQLLLSLILYVDLSFGHLQVIQGERNAVISDTIHNQETVCFGMVGPSRVKITVYRRSIYTTVLRNTF
jgi:hypothetical protein